MNFDTPYVNDILKDSSPYGKSPPDEKPAASVTEPVPEPESFLDENSDDSRIPEETDAAVDQLIEGCERLMGMIEDLKAENNFLTDTFINMKKSNIVSERRKLIDENIRMKKQTQEALAQSQMTVEDYNDKLSLLTAMVNEARRKQNDTNTYIEQEAALKAKQAKKKFSVYFRKKEAELKKEYEKKHAELEKAKRAYEGKMLMFMATGGVMFILGIAMLVISMATH